MTASETDSDLTAAITLFNRGEYLAAHEVLDDLWEATSGPEADFYKGLIQASVALHHLEEENHDGALKLEKGARRLLASYLPAHRGLDLARFLAVLKVRVRDAGGADASGAPRPRLDRSAGA